MSDIQANIKIDVETSDAMAEIRALQRAISDFNQSVVSTSAKAVAEQKSLNAAMAGGLVASKQVSVSYGTAKTSIQSFSESLEKGKLSFGEYVRYGAASMRGFGSMFKKEHDLLGKVAEERVKKLQTQYTALGQTINGVTKVQKTAPMSLDMKNSNTQMAVAVQRQQLFNKILSDGTTRMINWGKNTQWAGRQLMVGFTVPLMVGAAKASKIFADLEKQSIRFRRVYGDMFTSPADTDKALADMRALGVEMSKYGVAVADTIRMSADAAAAGKQGAELRATVTQAIKLAVLGEVEQQQALETTIALQNAYKISAKDLGSTINYLNAVENQSILSLQDVSAAIPRLGPIIQQLGGDIKDTTVFLAAMRESGISAEQGANALKSGLASLINPTKRASESLNALGIDLDAMVIRNKGNLMGLVQEFGAAMSQLDGLAKTQALEEVFGKFQFARMGALLQNIVDTGSQANQVLKLTQTSAIELAALSQKELGAVAASPVTQLQAAMEKLRMAVAPIGETMTKAALPLVEFFTKVAGWINKLPDGVKNFITLLVGVGPVALMLAGLIGNALGNLLKGLHSLGAVFKQIFMGGSKDTKYLTDAQLEAIAATTALEGQVHSLTAAVHLQDAAMKAMITTLRRYAKLANETRLANPAGFRRMAVGGTVPGSGNQDSQPTLLTPGEFVVNKRAAQKFGPILSAMNSGSIQMLAKGTTRKWARGEKAHLTEATQITPAEALVEFEGRLGPQVEKTIKLFQHLNEKLKGSGQVFARLEKLSNLIVELPASINGLLRDVSLTGKNLLSGSDLAKSWKNIGAGKWAPTAQLAKIDIGAGVKGQDLTVEQRENRKLLKQLDEAMRKKIAAYGDAAIGDRDLAKITKEVLTEMAGSTDPALEKLAKSFLELAEQNDTLRWQVSEAGQKLLETENIGETKRNKPNKYNPAGKISGRKNMKNYSYPNPNDPDSVLNAPNIITFNQTSAIRGANSYTAKLKSFFSGFIGKVVQDTNKAASDAVDEADKKSDTVWRPEKNKEKNTRLKAQARAKARKQGEAIGEAVAEGTTAGLQEGAVIGAQTASPSKRAKKKMVPIGEDIAEGAIEGLVIGARSTPNIAGKGNMAGGLRTGEKMFNIFKFTAAADGAAMAMSMFGGKVGEIGNKMFMLSNVIGAVSMAGSGFGGILGKVAGKFPVLAGGLTKLAASMPQVAIAAAAVGGAIWLLTRKTESAAEKMERAIIREVAARQQAATGVEALAAKSGIAKRGETKINLAGSSFEGQADILGSLGLKETFANFAGSTKTAAESIANAMTMYKLTTADLSVVIDQYAAQIARNTGKTIGAARTEVIAQMSKLIMPDNTDALTDPMKLQAMVSVMDDPKSGIKATLNLIEKKVTEGAMKMAAYFTMRNKAAKIPEERYFVPSEAAVRKAAQLENDQKLKPAALREFSNDPRMLENLAAQAEKTKNLAGAQRALTEAYYDGLQVQKMVYSGLAQLNQLKDQGAISTEDYKNQQKALADQLNVVNVAQPIFTAELMKQPGALDEINKTLDNYLVGLGKNKEATDTWIKSITDMKGFQGKKRAKELGRVMKEALLAGLTEGQQTQVVQMFDKMGESVRKAFTPDHLSNFFDALQSMPDMAGELMNSLDKLGDSGLNKKQMNVALDIMFGGKPYSEEQIKKLMKDAGIPDKFYTDISVFLRFKPVVDPASAADTKQKTEDILKQLQTDADAYIEGLKNEAVVAEYEAAQKFEAGKNSKMREALAKSFKEIGKDFKVLSSQSSAGAETFVTNLNGKMFSFIPTVDGVTVALKKLEEQQRLNSLEADKIGKQYDAAKKKLDDFTASVEKQSSAIEKSYQKGPAMLNAFKREDTINSRFKPTTPISQIKPAETGQGKEFKYSEIGKIDTSSIDAITAKAKTYLKTIKDASGGVASGAEAWDLIGQAMDKDLDKLQTYIDGVEAATEKQVQNIEKKYDALDKALSSNWLQAKNMLNSGDFFPDPSPQFDDIASSFDKMSNSLNLTFDGAGNQIVGKTKVIGTTFNAETNKMEISFRDLADAIARDAQASADAVEAAYTAAVNAINKNIDDRIKDLQTGWDEEAKKASRSWDNETTKIERDWEDATKDIEDGYQDLRDAAEESYDAQREAAEEAFQAQRDAAEEAFDAQREAMDKAHDEEMEAFDKAADKRKDALRKQQDAEKKAAEAQFDTSALDKEKEARVEKINQAFDSQLDALKEVADYEKFIADQKGEQLDLASAIAKGDIAAAARAATAMTQGQSEFQRGGLEKRLGDTKEKMLKDIETEYEARKAAIEAGKEAAMAALDEKHQAEMDALDELIESEREALEEAYEAKVDAMEKQHKIDMDNMDKAHKIKMDDMDKEHKKKMDDMDEAHEKSMTQRARDHEDAMTKRQQDHEDELEKQQLAHQKILDDLETERTERIRVAEDVKKEELAKIGEIKSRRDGDLTAYEGEVVSSIGRRKTAELNAAKEYYDKLVGPDGPLQAYKNMKTEVDNIGVELGNQQKFMDKELKTAQDAQVTRLQAAVTEAENLRDRNGEARDNIDDLINNIMKNGQSIVDEFKNALFSAADSTKTIAERAEATKKWADALIALGNSHAELQLAANAISQMLGKGDAELPVPEVPSNVGSLRAQGREGDSDTLLRGRFTGGAKSLLEESLTGMNGSFKKGLANLLREFPGTMIHSAYRPVWYQEQLWQNALKKYGSAAAARKWVAPPGKSMHGKGLAADLTYTRGEGPAVRAAASKYGLKFPMTWEPWHIETSSARGAKADEGDDDEDTNIGVPSSRTGDKGNQLTPAQVVSLMRKAGFPENVLALGAAIVGAESGGWTRNTNKKGNSAGIDRGLWQINSYYHPSVSDEEAFNPDFATEYANKLYVGRNPDSFLDWSAFKNGNYKSFLGVSDYNKPIPKAATGAVVKATPGGSIWRVGEAGQTEIIAPQPMLYGTVKQAINDAGMLASNKASLDEQDLLKMRQALREDLRRRKEVIKQLIDEAKAAGKSSEELKKLEDQLEDVNQQEVVHERETEDLIKKLRAQQTATAAGTTATTNATTATTNATTATTTATAATTTNTTATAAATTELTSFKNSLAATAAMIQAKFVAALDAIGAAVTSFVSAAQAAASKISGSGSSGGTGGTGGTGSRPSTAGSPAVPAGVAPSVGGQPYIAPAYGAEYFIPTYGPPDAKGRAIDPIDLAQMYWVLGADQRGESAARWGLTDAQLQQAKTILNDPNHPQNLYKTHWVGVSYGPNQANSSQRVAAANTVPNAQQNPAAPPDVPLTTNTPITNTYPEPVLNLGPTPTSPPATAEPVFYGGSNPDGSPRRIGGLSVGGWVSGHFTGGDSVIRALTPGEFVVKRGVAQNYGKMLSRLNATGDLDVAPTVVSASQQVSNVYHVNVTAQTNANPNEIASVVIREINRGNDRQVRGFRR